MKIITVILTTALLFTGCASYSKWKPCEDQTLIPHWTLVSRSAQPWGMVVPEQYEYGIMVGSNKIYKFQSWWRGKDDERRYIE